MARGRLTPPQACQSWRATARSVRKRRDSWASGCPTHPLALSVNILFLCDKSQRAPALLVEGQDASGCCIPVPKCCCKYIPTKGHIAGPWSLGQAGLAPAPWGAWRDEGQCKKHRASYPAIGKGQAWAFWVSQLACHMSSNHVSEKRGQG